MGSPRDFPGMTLFQRDNMGRNVTGPSGVIPFYRTPDGHIRTPQAKQGTVFQKK